MPFDGRRRQSRTIRRESLGVEIATQTTKSRRTKCNNLSFKVTFYKTTIRMFYLLYNYEIKQIRIKFTFCVIIEYDCILIIRFRFQVLRTKTQQPAWERVTVHDKKILTSQVNSEDELLRTWQVKKSTLSLWSCPLGPSIPWDARMRSSVFAKMRRFCEGAKNVRNCWRGTLNTWLETSDQALHRKYILAWSCYIACLAV